MEFLSQYLIPLYFFLNVLGMNVLIMANYLGVLSFDIRHYIWLIFSFVSFIFSLSIFAIVVSMIQIIIETVTGKPLWKK